MSSIKPGAKVDWAEMLSDLPDLEGIINEAVAGLKAAKADGIVTPEEIIDLEQAVMARVAVLLKKVLAQSRD